MIRGSIRGTTLLATVTLLAACAQKPAAPLPIPPQQVETGSRFVVRSPLVFPPGSAELIFQGGQVIGPAQLAQDVPHCRLNPEPGAPRSIPPGRLTVGSVEYDERGAGSAGRMVSVTRIALLAEANRPGYTMSCGWPAGAPARGFVSTEQIFAAIGGSFSMDLLR